MSPTRTGGPDERGAVTAETAMVLPLIAISCVGLAWLVCLAVVQVRAVDAAREVARQVARGEQSSTAVSLGRRVATDGSRFSVRQGDGTTTVVVSAPVRGPGGIFAALPGVTIRARAVAATEPR